MNSPSSIAKALSRRVRVILTAKISCQSQHIDDAKFSALINQTCKDAFEKQIYEETTSLARELDDQLQTWVRSVETGAMTHQEFVQRVKAIRFSFHFSK